MTATGEEGGEGDEDGGDGPRRLRYPTVLVVTTCVESVVIIVVIRWRDASEINWYEVVSDKHYISRKGVVTVRGSRYDWHGIGIPTALASMQ